MCSDCAGPRSSACASAGINFFRETLEVAETIAEVKGELMRADVKSRASRRTLAIPPFLVALLSEHLARRGLSGAEPDALVFAVPSGAPLRATNFRRRVWTPAVQAASLHGLTFHGLRHTAVGLMIEVGTHFEAIKQRMGHSSIRVTSDVYGSLLPGVDASVTRGLEELFAGSSGLPAAVSPRPPRVLERELPSHNA